MLLIALLLTLPTSELVAVAEEVLNESATLDVAEAPLFAAAAPTAIALAAPELLFCAELSCELLSWLDVALSLAIAPDPDWVLLVVAVWVLAPVTLLTVLSGSAAKAFKLKAIEIAAAMIVRFMSLPLLVEKHQTDVEKFFWFCNKGNSMDRASLIRKCQVLEIAGKAASSTSGIRLTQ